MFEIFMNSILPNIFETIMTIVSMIVAYYVIPCIKNVLMPWLKDKHLHSVIKNFVQAVEKMAESGMIEKVDKKKKVIELLENKGIVVNEAVEALIESCVKELDIITSTIYEEIIEVDTEEN